MALQEKCDKVLQHEKEQSIVNLSTFKYESFDDSKEQWKYYKQRFDLEVHIRIASPPLLYPCYMGINIPTREELIANKLDTLKLAKHTGADSVAYLSVEGLRAAVVYNIDTNNKAAIGHCTACLTGKYPQELEW